VNNDEWSDGIGIKWIIFAQFPIDNMIILLFQIHKFKTVAAGKEWCCFKVGIGCLGW
jgi:hypothetical protein